MFQLIVIIVSLILSFFFAGTEQAFISVNRVRIELWRRQKLPFANLIADFLRHPERFIYTTLVGNNIANVAFASFATVYFRNYLGQELTWLMVTSLTFLVGEIIPKTVFRSLADWIVRRIAPILQFFYYVFWPMIWVVNQISRFLLKLFHYQEKEYEEFFTQRDVEILFRESHNRAHLEKSEAEFLQRILRLRHLKVRDVMIPRTEIVAVPENTSIKELIEVIHKSGHTKIPVYRENLDNIIGIVFLNDLFLRPKTLQEIIHPVMFVPETKAGTELLTEFRKNNTSIAIVVDEYGGTAGLVTIEDLVEELVGEIEDEFDEIERLIRKTGERTYSVNVRIELDKLEEVLGISLPRGDYETLAGFILNYLGHIPRRDEKFEYNGIKFVVTRATPRKIEWVRITLPQEN